MVGWEEAPSRGGRIPRSDLQSQRWAQGSQRPHTWAGVRDREREKELRGIAKLKICRGVRQGVKASRDNIVFPGKFQQQHLVELGTSFKALPSGVPLTSWKAQCGFRPSFSQLRIVVWQTTPELSGLNQWPFYLWCCGLVICGLGWTGLQFLPRARPQPAGLGLPLSRWSQSCVWWLVLAIGGSSLLGFPILKEAAWTLSLGCELSPVFRISRPGAARAL